MAVVAIVSASFCGGEALGRQVADELGYTLLSPDAIVADAAARRQVPAERIERAVYGPRSVFERLTHDKERSVAQLRESVIRLVADDRVVCLGPAVHLIPRTLSHVLRVALVASSAHRAQAAVEQAGLSSSEAKHRVASDDDDLARWTTHLFGLAPWDERLHDIVLPVDKIDPNRAVATIVAHANGPALSSGATVRRAVADAVLASRVAVALAEAGMADGLDVQANEDAVVVTINRYVILLERFEREIRAVASAVPGVSAVATQVGPHFRRPNVYPGLELDVPRKILLVDDEEEFVETLSERLETRNLESAIAYDGEQALAIAETDAPDVMVLDMKMPGMDGMEVLKRIKARHPRTEVIVLTGHGSEDEKAEALRLGAFAYLKKPAEIDTLASLMREAYRKTAGPAESVDEGGEGPGDAGGGEDGGEAQ